MQHGVAVKRNLTLLRSAAKIVTVSQRGGLCRAPGDSQKTKDSMPRLHRLGILLSIIGAVILFAIAIPSLRSRAGGAQAKPQAAPKAETKSNEAEAFRNNTLGVAYMNQQKFAEAQKYFEKALAADPKFAIARLNLGISLLSQQKLEAARAALEEATRLLPKDPYAWYNLGLIYKDTGEPEKGIDAFQHVTQLSPEADAHYFLGYLYTQLQRYDEAIAEFQKAIAAFPYHASAEFGIARAYQRKGDSAAARQHLASFQKITTEHLGSPFGAGYGDQGRFSLAELGHSGVITAPPAIPVNFKEQPLVADPPRDPPKLPGPSTGACFFDYDGDVKPDLFLVSASNDGTSRLTPPHRKQSPITFCGVTTATAPSRIFPQKPDWESTPPARVSSLPISTMIARLISFSAAAAKARQST